MHNGVNRQWLLAKRPEGMVSSDQFELREIAIPSLEQGQILGKVLLLSFDPTQRAWMSLDTYIPAVKLGEPMRAGGIAQIIESRHPKFRPGDIVNSFCGWQEYVVFEPDKPEFVPVTRIPGHLDPTLVLALSLTGLTAYFGLLEIGKPKRGETVLISGAAGATGSVAGQIAKLKGCRVVGVAGGERKREWLLKTAKFDAAVDYKNQNVGEELARICPEGIDVYFDNVGGPLLQTVLAQMATWGRIVLCGMIAGYNADKTVPGPTNMFRLITRRIRMEGFLVPDYAPRFKDARRELSAWLATGALKAHEDIREGFDIIPQTFCGLFQGTNIGKLMVKVSDPTITSS